MIIIKTENMEMSKEVTEEVEVDLKKNLKVEIEMIIIKIIKNLINKKMIIISQKILLQLLQHQMNIKFKKSLLHHKFNKLKKKNNNMK
jgi:hypothetical protein